MLFDSAQVSPNDLRAKVEATISSYLPQVQVDVSHTQEKVLLTLKASLENSDKCHSAINTALFSGSSLVYVRLKDEAGDYARGRAYPIISRIEQKLRAFINQKAIQVLGWDWWEQYAPTDMQAKVRRHTPKNSGSALLEGTHFDDLVYLITHEYVEWDDEKSISVTELADLVGECKGFGDFKRLLQSKTAKLSFWDAVFAAYFDDTQHWKEVQKELGFVIHQRHKVMHHRPFSLDMVTALEAKEEKLERLLGDTKPELTQPELEKVQKEVQELAPSYLHSDTSSVSDSSPEQRIETLLWAKEVLGRVREDMLAGARAAGQISDLRNAVSSGSLATIPSPKELARTHQNISSGLPTPEEAKRLQQEAQVAIEQVRHLALPGENLTDFLERVRSSAKAVQDLLPIIEQAKRDRGRYGK